MSSTSIFDLLGQPEEPQGPLASLAVQLQRQGGPSGFRQAFGQGLLNLSEAAQAAIPAVAEGGEGSFLPGLATGFLGALGAPARAAQARETQRQGLQAQLLQEGFRFLSPESQEKVLGAAGLAGLSVRRPAEDESASARAVAQQMAQLLADPKSPPAERQGAAEVLSSLDPNLGPVLQGLSFLDPEQTPRELSTAWLNVLQESSTDESFLAYLDPGNEAYGDISKLKPKVEREGAPSPSEMRDAKALSDYLQAQATAQVEGTTVDQAAERLFAGDQPRAANVSRFFGQVAGPSVPTREQIALQIANAGFQANIMRGLAGIDPQMTEDVARSSFRLADEFIKQMGTRGIEPGISGPRRPRAAAGPGAFTNPDNQALLQAMQEAGVAGSDSVRTLIELRGLLHAMAPEDSAQIVQRAVEIRRGQ